MTIVHKHKSKPGYPSKMYKCIFYDSETNLKFYKIHERKEAFVVDIELKKTQTPTTMEMDKR
jgi:hypothetical protein